MRRSRALTMLIVGSVMVLLGPVIGLTAGGLLTAPKALDLAEDVVRVDPDAVVQMDSGERILLLAPASELARATHEGCSAVGPDGTEIPAETEAADLSHRVGGDPYDSFASITATTNGSHTIRCDGLDGLPVITAPPVPVTDLFGPLIWWALAGVIVAVVGLVLVVVGIVGLATGKRRAAPTVAAP